MDKNSKKFSKLSTRAFTLIELLIVIAIIAILAGVVFVALNPLKRFADARNANRRASVVNILQAIKLYQFDNAGNFPQGLNSTLQMIGPASSGCSVYCGAETGTSTEIAYQSTSEPLSYYSNITYSVRNWFNVNSVPSFSSLTASLVLDCDGVCNGTVKIRIGNTTTSTDYDLVAASAVRTDGTTANYTWYAKIIPLSKTTLGNYFYVQLLLYTGSGTIKFMMDESGPAGPDPEYRSGANGDGSQAGWNNDNGDYFIKISLADSAKTANACLNLYPSLTNYLGSMPKDPQMGTDNNSYYAIRLINNQILEATACGAENGETIQAKK